MDKETEILSRLAANHLHLAQFEPLKATLLALRVRNPDLALTILQTIVSNAGRFENVIWSRSCPSPSLLAFLSTIELLRFENPTSPWGLDSDTLTLRADFLLMVQVLIDRVRDSIRDEQRVELECENGELEKKDKNGGLGNCVRVLQGFLDLGVERLRFDVDTSSSGGSYMIEEDEFVSLRSIVLDYSDVFDALCCNIKRQLTGSESYVTCLVDEAERVEEQEMDRNDARIIGSREQDNNNVSALIQRNVQLAHLDAIRRKLDEGDERGATGRIRYLHLDYGIEKENYQYVLDLYSPQINVQLFYIAYTKSVDGFGLFHCFFFVKAGKGLITFCTSVCLHTSTSHVPHNQLIKLILGASSVNSNVGEHIWTEKLCQFSFSFPDGGGFGCLVGIVL